MQNQASRNAYDVIVVGAGLGSLAAGTLPAKAGQDVDACCLAHAAFPAHLIIRQ